MYLPRRLYEILPYGYLAVGLAAAIASYLWTGAAWSDWALGLGAVGIVAGFVLILRRRSYRDDEARYDRHSLDE